MPRDNASAEQPAGRVAFSVPQYAERERDRYVSRSLRDARSSQPL